MDLILSFPHNVLYFPGGKKIIIAHANWRHALTGRSAAGLLEEKGRAGSGDSVSVCGGKCVGGRGEK